MANGWFVFDKRKRLFHARREAPRNFLSEKETQTGNVFVLAFVAKKRAF
jgi:hypothetical protein